MKNALVRPLPYLDGLSSGGSPDRLDALVWAVTELTARPHSGPRIRML